MKGQRSHVHMFVSSISNGPCINSETVSHTCPLQRGDMQSNVSVAPIQGYSYRAKVKGHICLIAP